MAAFSIESADDADKEQGIVVGHTGLLIIMFVLEKLLLFLLTKALPCSFVSVVKT